MGCVLCEAVPCGEYDAGAACDDDAVGGRVGGAPAAADRAGPGGDGAWDIVDSSQAAPASYSPYGTSAWNEVGGRVGGAPAAADRAGPAWDIVDSYSSFQAELPYGEYDAGASCDDDGVDIDSAGSLYPRM